MTFDQEKSLKTQAHLQRPCQSSKTLIGRRSKLRTCVNGMSCQGDIRNRRKAGALLHDVSETASCVNGITKTQKCFPASRTQSRRVFRSRLCSIYLTFRLSSRKYFPGCLFRGVIYHVTHFVCSHAACWRYCYRSNELSLTTPGDGRENEEKG